MVVAGDAPSAGAQLPGSGRQRSAQRGRWLGRLGASAAALASLSLGALVLLGHQLDHPWLKPRIIALVHDAAGLGVDYSGLDVSLLRGVRARSFSILTPASLAPGAETFVQVTDLELLARPWALPFGERRIAALRVGSIEVAVVSDAQGRTTLSELFPVSPEPEPPAPSRLSQALVGLPHAALDRLEVGAIRVRWVELEGSRPVRSVELGGFGVDGRLESGEHGLAGSDVRVRGVPPLRLELRTGEQLQRAELGFAFAARAAGTDALAIEAGLTLTDQDLAPGWPRAAELLALTATLRFDAAAGRVSLELSRLEALARTLSLEAHAGLSDAGPLRLEATGTGAVHVTDWPPAGLPRAALPEALRGLSLGAFDLDVSAHELSWQPEGVHGSVDWRGAVRGFDVERELTSARLASATLNGGGTFEGHAGHFHTRLEASPSVRSPAFAGELEGLVLTLSGNTIQEAHTQSLDGKAELTLGSARLSGAAGEKLELAGARLRSRLSGSLAELPERVIPAFDADLAIARLEAVGGGRRVGARDLSASASLRRVAPDPASASGLAGGVEVSLASASLNVFEPARRAGNTREPRALVSIRNLNAQAALPLSLAEARGKLAMGALEAHEGSLSKLELEAVAQLPLAWAPGSGGEANATLSGRLGRGRVGTSRGALQAFAVFAQRLEGDRYRLTLDATAASLVGRGQRIPGLVTTELRADAALPAGTLALNAALRGSRAAPEARLDLNARVERDSGRVVYRAGLTADRLASLARLVTGATPSTAQVSLAANRLELSAQGALAGLLRAGPGPLPVPAEQPLRGVHGNQALRVELTGLDYRAPDRSLAIPAIAFDLESVHRAGGAGSAKARLRASALSYEGGGAALRLEGFNQKLSTTFEHATVAGAADIQSTLELAAATQSWVPGYPVRDLRCVTDLRLDGLSVFVRALSVDNPGGGTSLQASGALELLADGSAAATPSQTLAGREALSLDGRLQQVLEPLEQAGATARSRGTVAMPFRVESGGLLGYRLLATLDAKDVTFATHDGSLAIEELNGVIPIVEEIALLPGGLVMGVSPRSSPLSDARFVDVHPFLTGNNYVTARSIRAGGLPAFGPLAANVRLERTGLSIDQLQVGYSGGQIVGQARIAYRDGDPVVRLRLNATGLRSSRSEDVFDANATLSFEPVALTLDGKMQIVRASSSHVLDMLDMLDPYRESTNANRVRSALALGYPKFVRFKLHDGTVDAKVELGGIAQLVRLDEIKAIPLGPVMQRYLAPAFEGILPPRAPKPIPPAAGSAAQVRPEGRGAIAKRGQEAP